MNSNERLPSNRKLSKSNSRTVDLSRGEFQKLAKMVSDSIMAVSAFRPESNETSELRKTYDPIYHFMKKQAEIAFEREFDVFLMFGIHVDHIDLANGVFTIGFTHTTAQKDTVYKINFRNHLAPYSLTSSRYAPSASKDYALI